MESRISASKLDVVRLRCFPELAVGGFDRLDGTVQFYQRVRAICSPNHRILDFGAGRGAAHLEDPVPFRRQLMSFKGTVKEVVGADVDPTVKDNPALDRAIHISDDGILPLPSEYFDIVLSDWTFEHVGKTAPVAAELGRVLKRGGWICARTTNKNGYVALASRVAPASLRRWIVGRAQNDRKDEDVFPAYYKMNTRKALLKAFPKCDYEHYIYFWDGAPSYHFNSVVLYKLFLLVHRLTPAAFRNAIFAFLKKR